MAEARTRVIPAIPPTAPPAIAPAWFGCGVGVREGDESEDVPFIAEVVNGPVVAEVVDGFRPGACQ